MGPPQVVKPEKDLFKLPRYRGPLGQAPWSAVALTPELEDSLRAAALRSCPTCQGSGYTKDGDKAHPCTCINRRQETAS